jgi:small subunit ribosomal protein S2
MPYVTERWVGGFLTNFSTVKERINKYTALLKKREEGGFDKISRKEVVRINRDLERMEKNYSGVASLDTIPDVIFLVDPKKETACVREANILSVPIIALVDTDADPEVIDYPIPGNDDAIKSVRYIASCIVEAIKDGSKHADKIAREKKEQAESIGDAIEVDEQDLEEKITGKEEETPKRRTQRKGVK